MHSTSVLGGDLREGEEDKEDWGGNDGGDDAGSTEVFAAGPSNPSEPG